MCYLLCVKAGYIERGQGAAAAEHTVHFGYILGVKTGYIESCQGAAAAEHIVHIGYILSVEIIKPLDSRKF